MTKKICNCCGKEFDRWDAEEDFSMYWHVGYGSKHDGDTFDCDLCCDCFDRFADDLAAKCIHSPWETR